MFPVGELITFRQSRSRIFHLIAMAKISQSTLTEQQIARLLRCLTQHQQMLLFTAMQEHFNWELVQRG